MGRRGMEEGGVWGSRYGEGEVWERRGMEEGAV